MRFVRIRWSPRKRIALLAAAAATLALATYGAGLSGLDTDAILERRSWLAALAAAHPAMAVAAFAVVYVAGMSLALPLGGVLALIAGFLFGRWPGLALVVAAGTVSAALVFAVARRIVGDRVERSGLGIARLADAMRAHGFLCVLAMRIVPAFPFFVVTLVAAVTGVRRRAFLLATVLGKVPATLIYTGLGETLGNAGSLGEVVTTESIVGLTCLGALAAAPLAYRALRHRRRAPGQAASRTPSPLDSRSAPVSAS